MQMEKEIKKFFVKLYDKAARETGQPKNEIKLVFLLKSPTEYSCLLGQKQITLSDQDIKDNFGDKMNFFIGPSMVRSKINSFITGALLKFSSRHQIEKRVVNVAMTWRNEDFDLYLRNGNTPVKSVTIQEIIN